MKKILLFVLITASLAFTACSDNTETGAEAGGELSDNLGAVINDEKEVVVSDEGDNYEISTNGNVYNISLKDASGNEVNSLSFANEKPVITEHDNGYVQITLNSGDDARYSTSSFFDPTVNALSTAFIGVYDVNGSNIVMIDGNSVIVRDIFDDSKLNKMITEFGQELSPTLDAVINVEFSDDGSSVIVTYYAGDEMTETTETIAIN